MEQKKAHWLIEAITGISLLAVVGLIWYTAQQSKQIDDTEHEVTEVRSDLKEIKTTLGDIRTSLATALSASSAFNRDIDRNTRSIDALRERVDRINAFRDFRNNDRREANP